jgi:hypothetical protein
MGLNVSVFLINRLSPYEILGYGGEIHAVVFWVVTPLSLSLSSYHWVLQKAYELNPDS